MAHSGGTWLKLGMSNFIPFLFLRWLPPISLGEFLKLILTLTMAVCHNTFHFLLCICIFPPIQLNDAKKCLCPLKNYCGKQNLYAVLGILLYSVSSMPTRTHAHQWCGPQWELCINRKLENLWLNVHAQWFIRHWNEKPRRKLVLKSRSHKLPTSVICSDSMLMEEAIKKVIG